jgi:hypothetical protein
LATTFIENWRRTSAVPNKLAYVAWMTVKTVFTLSAVARIVWLFVTPVHAIKSGQLA